MRTWGGGGVVCVLVIFSHLTLFPTDPGWASGRGGWVCTSGSPADGQQVETKGAQNGVTIPFCVPQWEELACVGPFCVCCAQGEVEKS